MVMLKLGHEELEIRVECGGAKLQEYGRTVQGDQQECWIASNENTVSMSCASPYLQATSV